MNEEYHNDFMPRIWWPKSNDVLHERQKECEAAGFDLAAKACADEIKRREQRIFRGN